MPTAQAAISMPSRKRCGSRSSQAVLEGARLALVDVHRHQARRRAAARTTRHLRPAGKPAAAGRAASGTPVARRARLADAPAHLGARPGIGLPALGEVAPAVAPGRRTGVSHRRRLRTVVPELVTHGRRRSRYCGSSRSARCLLSRPMTCISQGLQSKRSVRRSLPLIRSIGSARIPFTCFGQRLKL
jgi:hypothetical protein